MSGLILIIEDEAALREMVGLALTRAGYEVAEAAHTREASLKIAERRPDLILLDWMLPEVSGIEYARRLKGDELTRDIPLIMLTARGDEADKVRGLETGADDYITKPFSPRELVARIKAVIRRAVPVIGQEMIEFDGLKVDLAGHRVTAYGDDVDMGPTEFKLLQFFITHPERVYSREQLLDRVWGRNVFIEERTIDVHIRRLRKVLELHGHDRFIQTVRGAGYRFSRRI